MMSMATRTSTNEKARSPSHPGGRRGGFMICNRMHNIWINNSSCSAGGRQRSHNGAEVAKYWNSKCCPAGWTRSSNEGGFIPVQKMDRTVPILDRNTEDN